MSFGDNLDHRALADGIFRLAGALHSLPHLAKLTFQVSSWDLSSDTADALLRVLGVLPELQDVWLECNCPKGAGNGLDEALHI